MREFQNVQEAREWAIAVEADRCCVVYPRAVQPDTLVVAEVSWGQYPQTVDLRARPQAWALAAH